MHGRLARSIGLSGLLTLATGLPASALTVGVQPALPEEGKPFTVVVGLAAGCPVPESVVVTPGIPGRIEIALEEVCSIPPQPRLVEVPIDPVAAGNWRVRVTFGGQLEEIPLAVEPPPFRIELDPPHPLAGEPFTLRLTGSASCPTFYQLQQDGYLLSLPFTGGCFILPPPPIPFELEQSLGPLPATDYVVQVTSPDDDRTLASHRFRVRDSFECFPSETTLCLKGGRYRVSASWRTATAEGEAQVRPETEDSGTLWFFSPDNLELLVKVLENCGGENEAVWVFAAGITNVEVDLTVTQGPGKQTWTYHNPAGTPFGPVLDTDALPCPLPPNV